MGQYSGTKSGGVYEQITGDWVKGFPWGSRLWTGVKGQQGGRD